MALEQRVRGNAMLQRPRSRDQTPPTEEQPADIQRQAHLEAPAFRGMAISLPISLVMWGIILWLIFSFL